MREDINRFELEKNTYDESKIIPKKQLKASELNVLNKKINHPEANNNIRYLDIFNTFTYNKGQNILNLFFKFIIKIKKKQIKNCK